MCRKNEFAFKYGNNKARITTPEKVPTIFPRSLLSNNMGEKAAENYVVYPSFRKKDAMSYINEIVDLVIV